jgi:hypothetical protein
MVITAANSRARTSPQEPLRVLVIHQNQNLVNRLRSVADEQMVTFERSDSLASLGPIGLLCMYDLIIADNESCEGLTGMELAHYIDVLLPGKALIILASGATFLNRSRSKLPRCIRRIVDRLCEPAILIEYILSGRSEKTLRNDSVIRRSEALLSADANFPRCAGEREFRAGQRALGRTMAARREMSF